MTKKEKADRIFSKYQRMIAANQFGSVRCSTCPAMVPWKHIDWGHWIVREHMATRYDYRNGGPQCHQCNRVMGGNQYIMSLSINARYGPKTTDALLYKKSSGRSPDIDKIIRVYGKLIKRHESKAKALRQHAL